MFVFNDERLRYLLGKLKVQFDKKIDKKQYGIIVANANNGGLKVVNGTPANDTEISLADAKLLNPNAQTGNFIEVKDKGLVEIELTPEEKELLQNLLNEEDIEEKLDNRLDNSTLDIMTQADFDALKEAGTLEENKIYIVTDSDKAIFVNDFISEEDLILFNNKVDKQKCAIEVEADDAGAFPAGSLEIVADNITPSDRQIKLADALLLYDRAEVGMHILKQDKVLSEVIYEQSDDDLINELLNIDFDKVLNVNDIADDLITDGVDDGGAESPEELRKVLSAKQGTKIEKDYLESIKHKYLTLKEYGDLFDITIDAAGTLTIVNEEDECDETTQIRIDDILIRAKNKGLAADSLLKVGDKVTIEDNSEPDTVYHITDNDEIYGLTEEQLNHLKTAYEHTLIDTDELYASIGEVHEARTNSDGNSFANLSERLFAIDELIEKILNSIN